MANDELDEIFAYNELTCGAAHAFDYIAFLQDGIDQLATDYEDGRPVEGFPERRSITLKWRKRGHGHAVIYRVDLDQREVNILHIFHTRQDIQGRMKGEG